MARSRRCSRAAAAVTAMVEACRRGPPGAHVDAIEEHAGTPEELALRGYHGFRGIADRLGQRVRRQARNQAVSGGVTAIERPEQLLELAPQHASTSAIDTGRRDRRGW